MGTRLLLYADLHLGRSDGERSFERPPLDDLAVDAIVSLGDVIDDSVPRSGREARRHERRGRAFFEHLDGAGVPVVAVPGDRDPVDCTERLAGGLSNVVVAHDRVLAAGDLPGTPDLDGCSLVGFGQRDDDASLRFPYTEFAAIDPRTTTNAETIGYVADDAADQVEAAVGGFLSGERTVDDVADDLGVQTSARERLGGYLDALAEEFRARRELLRQPDGDAILLSHVSPFNTRFDYRSSFDALDERLHHGSIALKMAVAATAPLVTLCGHTHVRDHDALDTVRGTRIAFNPGHPGVALVEIDRNGRSVDVRPPPF